MTLLNTLILADLGTLLDDCEVARPSALQHARRQAGPFPRNEDAVLVGGNEAISLLDLTYTCNTHTAYSIL